MYDKAILENGGTLESILDMITLMHQKLFLIAI